MSTVCGISSKPGAQCAKGITENTQYCEYNSASGRCKLKPQYKFDEVRKEIDKKKTGAEAQAQARPAPAPAPLSALELLLNHARNKIRLYKPQGDEELYPIINQDKKKLSYPEEALTNNKTHNLPSDGKLLIAEYKNEDQNIERSQHFLKLFRASGSVYEKIIYINRAIDTDIINSQRYIDAIVYYTELITAGSPFSAELVKEIEIYKSIISKIEEYNIHSCAIPILYDLEANKRVELDSWVLNNRRNFPEFINNFFLAGVDSEKRNVQYTFDTKRKTIIPVELLKHQKFISDFISRNTPYRGCLLYYGLGSGKTLSSINISEGSSKKSIILLPASIRTNFVDNIEKKGNTVYHTENHWCFIEIDEPERADNIAKLKQMGFPTDEPELMKELYTNINGRNGFWCVQKDPGSNDNNFETYNQPEQASIIKTVSALIKYKYSFAHYNGGGGLLRNIMITNSPGFIANEEIFINKVFGTSKKYDKFSPSDKKKYKNAILDHIFNDKLEPKFVNPFENKIIIIDEVHNFMSQLCNKSDNAMKLYQLLIRTKNSRIVALSGTPIINSPFELGLLFNLLKGYTIYYKFKIKPNPSVNIKEAIDAILKKNETIDHFQYQPIDQTLRIARIPVGFKKNSVGNAIKYPDYPNDTVFISGLVDEFRQFAEFKFIDAEYNSIYPDIFQNKSMNSNFVVNKNTIFEARNKYYEYYIDSATSEIHNQQEFMIRSLGIVSFFNESYKFGENIFPEKIQSSEPDFVDISNYQLISYNKKRMIERQLEKQNTKNEVSAIVAEIDSKVSNVFKVFSRQKLLFTFPPGIDRPELKQLRKDISSQIHCVDAVAECTVKNKQLEHQYNDLCLQVINELTPLHLTINESIFNLRTLSPKYAKMLENIGETPGLVFGYSQFRNVEGIEIFCRVLLANGYEKYDHDNPQKYATAEAHLFQKGNMVRFEKEPDHWISTKIINEQLANGTYQIEVDGRMLEVDPDRLFRCRFATWSGTEKVVQRETIRSNFNNYNNRYGQVLLIILTTSSGAEGIDLKNVRQVHIMEPYWNRVRVEQVIGRARRNYSHVDLPKEQQNVKIFQYVSRFTQSQRDGTWGKDLDLKQLVPLDDLDEESPKVVSNDELISEVNEGLKADNYLTSDEKLLEISNRKYEIISKFLDIIKRCAIDCKYNYSENILSDPERKNIECLTHIPGSGNDLAFDISKEPQMRDEEVYEKRVNKKIYILPYPTALGHDINLLYEINEDKDLLKTTENVPLYNFYSYFGINPIVPDGIEYKRLIGSILYDPVIQKLRIILSQEFTNNIPIYESVHQLLRDKPIPSFENKYEVNLFRQAIINDPAFKALQNEPELIIVKEIQQPFIGIKRLKLKIKKAESGASAADS